MASGQARRPLRSWTIAVESRIQTITSLAVVAALLIGALLVGGPLVLWSPGPAQPPSSSALIPTPGRYVSAWLPYWKIDAGLASFTQNADRFTDVTTFFHEVNGPDAQLADRADDEEVQRVIGSAHERGVFALAAVVDATDPGVMAAILKDPATRAAHISELLALVDEQGYDGIDIDYEQFAFADGRSTWAATRPAWVAFIAELAAELHGRGKLLTVAAPAQFDADNDDSSGFWVYDWPSIAPHVDQLRVMTYDYSTATPGPISPMPWVEQAATFGLSVVGPERLRIGVPTYGRDWATGSSGAGCAAADVPGRRSLTASQALELAASDGVEVLFDDTDQEAYFSYVQELPDCRVDHVVHFSDARSVAAKAEFARSNGTGIALWSLGGEDPATWEQLPGD